MALKGCSKHSKLNPKQLEIFKHIGTGLIHSNLFIFNTIYLFKCNYLCIFVANFATCFCTFYIYILANLQTINKGYSITNNSYSISKYHKPNQTHKLLIINTKFRWINFCLYKI